MEKVYHQTDGLCARCQNSSRVRVLVLEFHQQKMFQYLGDLQVLQNLTVGTREHTHTQMRLIHFRHEMCKYVQYVQDGSRRTCVMLYSAKCQARSAVDGSRWQ